MNSFKNKNYDMFTSKNKENVPSGPVSISIISADASITGDIQCKGDIRIDGKLTGNVQCDSKIIVGKSGHIVGNLIGSQAEILGQVNGNIHMSGQLNLNETAVVHGDVHVAKIKIDNSVVFNGKCTMGEKTAALETSTDETDYESI
jgi:cytoskeletal protein CcmA (bactofilin family)